MGDTAGAPTFENHMAKHHVVVGWMAKNKDKVIACGTLLDLTEQFGTPFSESMAHKSYHSILCAGYIDFCPI
jgi:hypothetical protein